MAATGRFTNPGFIEDDLLLEPTGRLSKTAGVLVVAFQDDRVVWVHCYYDDLGCSSNSWRPEEPRQTVARRPGPLA